MQISTQATNSSMFCTVGHSCEITKNNSFQNNVPKVTPKLSREMHNDGCGKMVSFGELKPGVAIRKKSEKKS